MPAPPLRARLRAALTEAMRSRDLVAAGVLRSALGEIDNAEAIVPAATGSTQPNSEHIAGAAAGLGAAEAARRELTEADMAAIVATEISERRSAADEYDHLSRPDQSERLRREAAVLADLLTAD